MNKFKLISLLFTFLQSSLAFATGPIDGIYNCVPGSTSANNTTSTYLVVNSNNSTTTISFPNTDKTIFTGYVLGAPATDTLFIGTSNKGYSINLNASGFQGKKVLNVTGSLSTKNGVVNGVLACNQIL